MSSATRLAKLEGALGPKEAVLLWLDEAHVYPSLSDYAAWLVEQPVSVAPLEQIPKLIGTSVGRAMRGQKGEVADAAIATAVADAVSRIEAVIKLDTMATDHPCPARPA